ncbi:MAG: TolC family protein [Gemmatimonadaceae bacterium]
MTRNQRALLLLITTAAPSQRALAQLTLAAAMHQADRSAFANRIAGGAAAERRAQALAPLKGILPSMHVEAGYVRTTDPIGAFGATLRQRTITQADFDPSRLNYPGAIGNYQGGIVIEQPLLNADAWLGRRAALHASDATRASESWTRLSIRVDVVRAYYGTVLATERVAMLQSAARAAHAHQAQAESMVRQGMVTKSDALLAAVRAGEIDAQLAEASGNAMTARRQLAVLLGGDGADDATSIAAPNALPSAERIRALVEADTTFRVGQPRADVDASSRGLDAARADAVRARSTYLPRINSFARYDWNSPARVYGGDRNWTVGVMATWSPFVGASEIADVQATSARETSARAQAEAAKANGRLQVEQTRTALAVALTRLEISERAVTQSAEANRIVARKYEGGLASVTELLDAQTADTQSALAFAQIRYVTIVAAAERRLATGGDPATLAALDDNSISSVRAARTTPDRDQK